MVGWDAWYQNASPGPFYPCTTSSGTVPTFDTDSIRNNSVAVAFNLTPASSYACTTDAGQISRDASSHTLTLAGTIFIDGSAYIQNGAVNTYTGQASLYLSGTFLIKNSSLCAVSSGGGCDSANWNPNATLLDVVANGNGGQVSSGDSIQLVSANYQGALFGTNAVQTDTTSTANGPIVGSTVILGQSASTSFPFITTVPTAMPSNPTVYAQPNPPSYTSG